MFSPITKKKKKEKEKRKKKFIYSVVKIHQPYSLPHYFVKSDTRVTTNFIT